MCTSRSRSCRARHTEWCCRWCRLSWAGTSAVPAAPSRRRRPHHDDVASAVGVGGRAHICLTTERTIADAAPADLTVIGAGARLAATLIPVAQGLVEPRISDVAEGFTGEVRLNSRGVVA